MKNLLILVVLISYGTSLYSQEWKAVASNSTNDSTYIDINSIKESKGKVRVWVKHLYNDIETRKSIIHPNIEFIHKYEYPNGVPPKLLLKWTHLKYKLSLELIDFETDTSKTEMFIYYTGDGEVLKSNDLRDESKFEYIVPGSLMSIISEEVYNLIKH